MPTKLLLSILLSLGLFACGDDGEEDGAEFCGGLRGAACAADEFCDYPTEARCGANDQGGSCQPRPSTCDASVSQVQGSDGEIYDNACLAHKAGADDCGPPEISI